MFSKQQSPSEGEVGELKFEEKNNVGKTIKSTPKKNWA